MRQGILAVVLAAALVATTSWTAPAASGLAETVEVDVLVVGGTPGGVAAAIAAAREGASVLLAEARPRLGGVLTDAWLTTFDVSIGADGQHLVRGIFLEQFRRLGISFDRGSAARVFGQAVMREPGLRTMTQAPVARVLTDGVRIAAVEFADQRWHRTIRVQAHEVIDATDDGDIAAAAGAPYVIGRPGYRDGDRWMQAATLIFRLAGVNWHDTASDILWRLQEGANVAHWGVNGPAAWGYPEQAAAYEPAHPLIFLNPLNLALERDGSVLVNALNITGVNGLDRESVDAGMTAARSELPRLVAYLRERIAGFEDARLAGHAPELYIRETRHVEGLYTLTSDDILNSRIFEDRVAIAAYPIDIHPYFVGWVNPFPREAIPYTIPFGALVPADTDNLLMASRAFSATSEAHGSARVVPTVMALGQAAGVAAALGTRLGRTPREIAESPMLMWTLQGGLIAQGANLDVGLGGVDAHRDLRRGERGRVLRRLSGAGRP
ncbi:MAG: FAD-dependent oxidoreductase [Armatimonadota bacterium]|nr:FAD-dependent oxidoreductase [Armatimonadota bacterium]